MTPCLIIGDSIAQGVAANLPACDASTHVGITAGAWLAQHGHVLTETCDVTVISLGANDTTGDDGAILRRIRGSISAHRVVWVAPSNAPTSRRNVLAIAADHGDAVLDVRAVPHDRIHPTAAGYQTLAKEVQ